jgi:pimeloyl-ACP methyl ester carboxylesterase
MAWIALGLAVATVGWGLALQPGQGPGRSGANRDRDWISVEPGLWKGLPSAHAIGTMKYALVVPADFDPEKTYPVLIALPPGEQDPAMVEAGLGLYWEAEAGKRGWVVVSPAAPGVSFVEGGERIFGRLLDDVAQRVKVEGGVFHVAGVSNGGRAAFRIAAIYGARVASLTVLPGYAEKSDVEQLGVRKGPAVTMHVGAKDEAWLKRSEQTRDALIAAGVEVSLNVVPGQEHVIKSLSARQLFDQFEKTRAQVRARGDGEAAATRLRAAAAASAVLDRLHEAASAAKEEPYFSLYTPDAVFLGTDPKERWTMAQFRAYAHPAFQRATGWTYYPVERSVMLGKSGDTAWFDESLDHARFGRCRGTGVLVFSNAETGWLVAQYNLSVPVPNEKLLQAVELWSPGKKSP